MSHCAQNAESRKMAGENRIAAYKNRLRGVISLVPRRKDTILMAKNAPR